MTFTIRSAIAMTLVGLALGPRAAGAQAIRAGQRVRITSAQYRLHLKVATLIAVDDSTITVAVTRYRSVDPSDRGFPDTVTLSRAGIDRLDVSVARTRGTKTGALFGLVSGAVVGGIIGAASYEAKECGPPNPEIGVVCISPPWSRGNLVVVGAATVGLIGAGIGSVIGSASYGDRWEGVAVKRLQHGGVGLGLGIRF